MEPIFVDYLDKFEEKLRKSLLTICTGKGKLDGKLLESVDITDYWKKIEANYMADAVPEIVKYPSVSVAWAAYLGMAVARNWDEDWNKYSSAEYESYYGDNGFDNMDDHIVADILGMPLNGDDAKALVSLVQSLANESISMIRHEHIEAQSKMAFYAFSRACNAMFAIGAALELRRMGYKFERM